jgi:hypothetical protein
MLHPREGEVSPGWTAYGNMGNRMKSLTGGSGCCRPCNRKANAE